MVRLCGAKICNGSARGRSPADACADAAAKRFFKPPGVRALSRMRDGT